MKAVKGIVTTVTKVTRGEEVPDRQPLADRPHAADRAPQPHQPAVQAGRYRQAGRGHARGLPLPDAGEGRRDQDLHGQGRERRHRRRSQLTNNADDQIRYFINLTEASPALKQKLTEALKIKGEWDAARRELAQVVADLQRLNADQDRIRKNLRETPKEAEVYADLPEEARRPGEGDRRPDRQAEEADDRRVRGPQEVRRLPRQHLRLIVSACEPQLASRAERRDHRRRRLAPTAARFVVHTTRLAADVDLLARSTPRPARPSPPACRLPGCRSRASTPRMRAGVRLAIRTASGSGTPAARCIVRTQWSIPITPEASAVPSSVTPTPSSFRTRSPLPSGAEPVFAVGQVHRPHRVGDEREPVRPLHLVRQPQQVRRRGACRRRSLRWSVRRSRASPPSRRPRIGYVCDCRSRARSDMAQNR